MKTIEIDCRKCANCTGNECKEYGNDANKAVAACAKDGFKKYINAHKNANHARWQEGRTMERLTFKKWFENYKPDEETTTVSVKGHTQITEQQGARGAKGFYLVGEAVDKLAEYEDAEEAGTLLRLPCNVGDDVYVLQYGEDKPFIIVETKIIEIRKNLYGCFFVSAISRPAYKIEDFGKTVFLTREAAEQALKEGTK